MHIPVKITTQASFSSCKYCGAPSDGTAHFIFTVELREGIETVGPYCPKCLGSMEMLASIEPPPIPKGAAPPSRKLRRRVRTQERGIAEDLGGRAQPGSGNQLHKKGDVRLKGKYRLEAKLTTSKQFILQRTFLEKISGECSGLERPGLILEYTDRRTLRSLSKWAVIPYDDFLDFSGKREAAATK
jgi:hypothetical protein